MDRIAFKMKLSPGKAQEYKKRHDEIWLDLSKLLKKVGIGDYAIFLDEETNILFATLKIRNKDDMERLPQLQVVRDWWQHMADIMETNPDQSPIVKNLREMFYLP